MMRVARIGALVALVLAASGCGAANPAGSVPAGAHFAPASTVVYLTGITDPASSQWQNADKLLKHFPGRDKLLASARKDLQKDGLTWERDVKPALGGELSLALLSFDNADNNYVFFTKPKDEAKFDKFIEAGDPPQVHRKIDGWTVFADKKVAIDNFVKARASGGSLADRSAFQDAMSSLPKDSALRGYLSGESLYALLDREALKNPGAQNFRKFSGGLGKLESVSFSTGARSNGVAVDLVYASTTEAKLGSYSAKLDGKLPAGALLYLSFGNLEDSFNQGIASVDKSIPGFKQQRLKYEDALGFSLTKDLFPLFSKEGALAVYKGRPIPGIVFMLDVSGNEGKADTVMRRFGALASMGGGAQTRTFQAGGVTAREIRFPAQSFSIFSAIADGTLVVTNVEQRLRDSLGGGAKLADDPLYKATREAAKVPDQAAFLFYADLKDGLPYVFDYAEQSTPCSITPDVRANARPLQSVFLYSKQDGKRVSLSGFVAIQ